MEISNTQLYIVLAIYISFSFLKACLILYFSIFIHELGHYLAALYLKMKVFEFKIGNGPSLLSFVYNDIDFKFHLSPSGGHICVPGTGVEELSYFKTRNIEPLPEHLDRDYIPSRELFLSVSGPLANIVLLGIASIFQLDVLFAVNLLLMALILTDAHRNSDMSCSVRAAHFVITGTRPGNWQMQPRPSRKERIRQAFKDILEKKE